MVFIAPVLPLDVAVVASALERAGSLDRLVTRWCFTASELIWLRRIGFSGGWIRRPCAPVASNHLKRLASADVRALIGRWSDKNSFQAIDDSFAMVDHAAATLVTRETRGIIGREDGCLMSFQKAKQLDLPRIYQLQTAHYATARRLIWQEAADFPEAFNTAELKKEFGPERVARKDGEMQCASHILCISSFVQRTVEAAGISSERITAIPLAADTRWSPPASGRRESMFLYVGNISARKGVHRVIRMWRKLGAYRTHRLRLIGDLHLPASFLREYQSVFEHQPRRPREELPGEYSRATAFVFNAMADGFGHVFAEAMVCGTPVLASRNCGAPDLIKDGVEGRLFEYGDDEALGSALDWALSHPNELAEMGACARSRATQWGCEQFTQTFLKWIAPIIGKSSTPEGALETVGS